MATRLNPYLNFRDTARQAMEFYQSVLGGELTTSTFGEFGASDDPAEKDKFGTSWLVNIAGQQTVVN
jgi:PhnB protein